MIQKYNFIVTLPTVTTEKTSKNLNYISVISADLNGNFDFQLFRGAEEKIGL